MKNKFITILLALIAIVLIIALGILGTIIYGEISGQQIIDLGFIEDFGYPTTEYNASIENTNTISSSEGTIGNVEGYEPKQSSGKNLYEQLDTNAKIIYDKLYDSKESLKTGRYQVDFGDTFHDTLSQENGSKELQKQYQSAIEALIYENPDIFYLDPNNMFINIEETSRIWGSTYNVFINNGTSIDYLDEGFESKEDVDQAQKEIEEVKNEIIAKTNGKNDYEKIKIVHDYLIDTIDYETTVSQDYIYNIYGALVLKNCVCEGYAKSFQYLMDELGFENTIVIGTGTNSKNETENHAWNYVKLNGAWYAVDVTWDDPIIIGGGKLSDSSRYKYFLKGSETMSKNHVVSEKFTDAGQSFTYPELNKTDYPIY